MEDKCEYANSPFRNAMIRRQEKTVGLSLRWKQTRRKRCIVKRLIWYEVYDDVGHDGKIGKQLASAEKKRVKIMNKSGRPGVHVFEYIAKDERRVE